MSGLRARLLRMLGRSNPSPAAPAEAPPRIAPSSAAPARHLSASVTACHLRSAQAYWLQVRDGRLTAAPARDPAYAAIALLPQALPGRVVLLGADAAPFTVTGDTMRGVATSVLAMQTDVRRIVRLKYPLGGPVFLTIDPNDATALAFAGAGDTMQATFMLVEMELDSLPTLVRTAASEIGQAASDGLRAAPLLDRLRRTALRPELAQALARLMPLDEQEALAAALLDHPPSLAAFGRAAPDDIWLNRVLPDLASWRKANRPEAQREKLISPAEDEAALLPAGERGLVPLGLALTGLARRQVRPTRLACLLATARNEGPYLLDWIGYHLSIGFEHIFLYSNDNEDGSDALLAALARGGAITWIDNLRGPTLGPQPKAYTHALTMLPQILDYRWTAILDVDEYLGFDAKLFDGIADFIALQECQTVDAIALCWLFFAALPGEVWSDASPVNRFARRDRPVNAHVKTLFRTRLFWHSQPHFPTAVLDAPFTYRTQDGHLHHHAGVRDRIPAFAEHPSATQAWINHYFVRTADEALWKWSRGRADWPRDDVVDRRSDFLELIATSFLDFARPEHLVEDARILACAKGVDAMRTKLLALPGVAAADAAIKTTFAGQLARTKADFLSSSLGLHGSDAVRQFREILA